MFFVGLIKHIDFVVKNFINNALFHQLQTLNTQIMKTYTPLKSFISLENTPQKQVVGYEINSWMQTNDKKRSPSAFIKPSMKVAQISPKNRSSLATLRQKRLDLLKKSTKKYQTKLNPIAINNPNCQKFVATATTQSPQSLQSMKSILVTSVENNSKKTKVKQIIPPIIQVSEFNAQQKSQTYRKGRKWIQSLLRGKSGKKVINISVQIQNNIILQTKVTQNQYKKMSFVSKKLTKVN